MELIDPGHLIQHGKSDCPSGRSCGHLIIGLRSEVHLHDPEFLIVKLAGVAAVVWVYIAT